MAAFVKTFGFLKKFPKRGIVTDSTEPKQIEDYETLKPDFSNQCC